MMSRTFGRLTAAALAPCVMTQRHDEAASTTKQRTTVVSTGQPSPEMRKPLAAGSRGSGENLVDAGAVNIGQAIVAALKAIGQPLMVEAQQVKDRGVQIVDVDRAGFGGKAQLIGPAVDVARLDSGRRPATA